MRDSLRHFAAEGTGNLITIDGSVDGMSNTIRQMMAAGHFIGNPPGGNGNGSGDQVDPVGLPVIPLPPDI